MKTFIFGILLILILTLFTSAYGLTYGATWALNPSFETGTIANWTQPVCNASTCSIVSGSGADGSFFARQVGVVGPAGPGWELQQVKATTDLTLVNNFEMYVRYNDVSGCTGTICVTALSMGFDGSPNDNPGNARIVLTIGTFSGGYTTLYPNTTGQMILNLASQCPISVTAGFCLMTGANIVNRLNTYLAGLSVAPVTRFSYFDMNQDCYDNQPGPCTGDNYDADYDLVGVEANLPPPPPPGFYIFALGATFGFGIYVIWELLKPREEGGAF